jgi:flagellar hook-basal body complex protein FliE
MNVPVQSIGSVSGLYGSAAAGAASGGGISSVNESGMSFKDTLAQALGEVQGLQDGASDAVEAFLRGDPVELHDVMAAVEEAGLALEMLVEVRNRVVDAYRTVVNMQS